MYRGRTVERADSLGQREPPRVQDENAETMTMNLTAPGIPSIAVLDFVNHAGDPSLEWLSVAVAETLSSDLRKVGSLRVVDRQQVIRAVRQTDSVQGETGADLGVRWLVRGSVEGSAANLRVSA